MLALHHAGPALAGLIASFLMLLPGLARAQCAQWQLPAKFNAVEDSGFFVVFDLERTAAGRYAGSAHYNSGADFREVRGQASAKLDGVRLDISVVWQTSYGTYYSGTVDSGGAMAGLRLNPVLPAGDRDREVFWSSRQKAVCVDGPVEVRTPKGPTILRLEPPVARGLHVDNCRTWATDCGRVAALAFCQSRGFPMLHAFQIFDRYVGDTYVVGSKEICTGDGCRAFSFIECEKPLTPERAPGMVENLTGLKSDPGRYVKGTAPAAKPLKTLGQAKAATAAAAAAATTATAIDALTARVVADVDVYGAPGGAGAVTGMLAAGSTVVVAAWPCADNWCEVSGGAVPGGRGWVYSGPDYVSLQR